MTLVGLFYNDPHNGQRLVWRFRSKARAGHFLGVTNPNSMPPLHRLGNSSYSVRAITVDEARSICIDDNFVKQAAQLYRLALPWNLPAFDTEKITCSRYDCRRVQVHDSKHFVLERSGNLSWVCRNCKNSLKRRYKRNA